MYSLIAGGHTPQLRRSLSSTIEYYLVFEKMFMKYYNQLHLILKIISNVSIIYLFLISPEMICNTVNYYFLYWWWVYHVMKNCLKNIVTDILAALFILPVIAVLEVSAGEELEVSALGWCNTVSTLLDPGRSDLYYVEIVQRLEQSSNTVLCRFMKRHFPDSSLYWSWNLDDDGFSVHKACVLPIRPSLDICLKYSNSRKIVYTLQNEDIINKFAL